jgi:hypothetical protein
MAGLRDRMAGAIGWGSAAHLPTNPAEVISSFASMLAGFCGKHRQRLGSKFFGVTPGLLILAGFIVRGVLPRTGEPFNPVIR